jgi:hypothetical protein
MVDRRKINGFSLEYMNLLYACKLIMIRTIYEMSDLNPAGNRKILSLAVNHFSIRSQKLDKDQSATSCRLFG